MAIENKKLSRTAVRRIVIILVLLLLAIATFIYTKGSDLRLEVGRKEQYANKLREDIDTSNVFSAARADLDNLTLDEHNSTQLAILRHLDLQESNLAYRTKSKTVKNVNGTNVVVRQFVLTGETTYQEILSQLDWLQTSKKAILTSATLRSGYGFGNAVSVEIEGLLYGLYKE